MEPVMFSDNGQPQAKPSDREASNKVEGTYKTRRLNPLGPLFPGERKTKDELRDRDASAKPDKMRKRSVSRSGSDVGSVASSSKASSSGHRISEYQIDVSEAGTWADHAPLPTRFRPPPPPWHPPAPIPEIPSGPLIRLDPDCAICRAPASMGCGCETKALETAVNQAESRMMTSAYADMRMWVREKAQDDVLEYFRVLAEKRKAAYYARVGRLKSSSGYYYNTSKNMADIAAAQAALKRDIDEDWQASVQRYPEILDYFFSMIEISIPGRNNKDITVSPPLTDVLRKGPKRHMPPPRVRSSMSSAGSVASTRFSDSSTLYEFPASERIDEDVKSNVEFSRRFSSPITSKAATINIPLASKGETDSLSLPLTVESLKEAQMFKGNALNEQTPSPNSGEQPTFGMETFKERLRNAIVRSQNESSSEKVDVDTRRANAQKSVDHVSLAKIVQEQTDFFKDEDEEISGSELSWSTSWSEDIESIDMSHPLWQLRAEYLQKVVAAYDQDQNNSSSGGTGAGPTDSRPNRERSSSSQKSRKHGRSSDSTSDNGERVGTRASSKRRAVSHESCFACPFAKNDPIRHRDCYRYFLTRIRDVKQHLKRCHRVPIHCPRCAEIFSDEDDRDEHLRSANCTVQPVLQIEGVSEKQQKLLSQRVSSRMSEEEQWFTVFDILLPGHPRPRSPYLDRELSEPMQIFRDFLLVQGRMLLSEFLESREAITWNYPPEERDLEAFQESTLADGLQLIFDRFTASSSAHAPSSSNVSSSPSMPQSIDTALGMQASSSTTTLATTSASDSTNECPSSTADGSVSNKGYVVGEPAKGFGNPFANAPIHEQPEQEAMEKSSHMTFGYSVPARDPSLLEMSDFSVPLANTEPSDTMPNISEESVFDDTFDFELEWPTLGIRTQAP